MALTSEAPAPTSSPGSLSHSALFSSSASEDHCAASEGRDDGAPKTLASYTAKGFELKKGRTNNLGKGGGRSLHCSLFVELPLYCPVRFLRDMYPMTREGYQMCKDDYAKAYKEALEWPFESWCMEYLKAEASSIVKDSPEYQEKYEWYKSYQDDFRYTKSFSEFLEENKKEFIFLVDRPVQSLCFSLLTIAMKNTYYSNAWASGPKYVSWYEDDGRKFRATLVEDKIEITEYIETVVEVGKRPQSKQSPPLSLDEIHKLGIDLEKIVPVTVEDFQYIPDKHPEKRDEAFDKMVAKAYAKAGMENPFVLCKQETSVVYTTSGQ